MTIQASISYQIKSPQNFTETTKLMHLRISELNPMYIVHKALTKQMHEKRQGNANCKTRSQVRGGGKKPWRQKGTGKARAGSIRSPLWRGGGVVFGPTTKEYKKKLNRKERKLAFRNLIYNKQQYISAVDTNFLEIHKPSTKLLLNKIHQLNISPTAKILIIVTRKELNMYLSTRNLKNIELIAANQLNLISIINAKFIIAEIDALNIIQKIYNE